jgi:hypothetical protein
MGSTPSKTVSAPGKTLDNQNTTKIVEVFAEEDQKKVSPTLITLHYRSTLGASLSDTFPLGISFFIPGTTYYSIFSRSDGKVVEMFKCVQSLGSSCLSP